MDNLDRLNRDPRVGPSCTAGPFSLGSPQREFVVVTVNTPEPSDRVAPTTCWTVAQETASVDPKHGRVADALMDIASRAKEHPAVVVGSHAFSFQRMAAAANTVADSLLREGDFEPGDRVALLLGNGSAYVATFYGALAAGAVVVPLAPATEAHRLDHILRTCGVAVVLTDARTAARRKGLREKTQKSLDLRKPAPGPIPNVEPMRVAGQTLAMIMFTSGSSGDPKGVMLSDANLLANARSILQFLPIRRDDRALALLPFYHAFGNSVLQTHLLVGASLIIDGSFTFPRSVVDAMCRHRATSLSAVPEAFHLLLSHSDLGTRHLPDLRYMAVAGGALKPTAVLEVADRVAPAEFYVMYGQTEATARLAYLPPEHVKTRPHSIGKAIPGVELRVKGEEDKDVEPGEVGEVCARGPNVMLGYWQDPDASTTALRDGWLRTGDVATVDEEGYVYVKSRKNDLVKIQGIRTHPREVEDVIARAYPGMQIMVVPYQHRHGTRLALYVVPGDGSRITVAQIRRQCMHELPRPIVPTYIEILPHAPLSSAMKLDRVALTRRAESQARGGAADASADVPPQDGGGLGRSEQSPDDDH